MRMLYHAVTALLLSGMLGWVVVNETIRQTQLATLTSAYAQIDRETARIESVKEAQEYAEPIVALAEQLGRENVMFSASIDRARKLLIERTEELEQTREALSHSVQLLQDQIDENNRYIDYMQVQDSFIQQLLQKIPEGARVEPPKFED